MATETARRISRDEARGSWLLWIGVLTGPLAWALHLTINYSLEEWFACSPATQTPGEIMGLGVDTIALAVNAVLFVATIVAGLIALSCWRKIRGGTDDGEMTRPAWMALAGMMNSVLYFIIILFGFAPPLILGVCQGAS